MGGNAFSKTERMSAEKYVKKENEILNLLVSNGVSCITIPYIKNKKDFGDIDLIVDASYPYDEVLRIANPDEIKENISRNGESVQTSIKKNSDNHQIDLIFMKKGEMDFARNWLAWGGLGDFFEQIYKKLGFKLSSRGLFYNMKGNDGSTHPIQVTDSFEKAMDLLGADMKRINQGFDTQEELFDFIMGNEYFSPVVFLLGDQKENKPKRKMAADFDEHIKSNMKHHSFYMNYRDMEQVKSIFFKKVIARNPGFKKRYEFFREQDEKEKFIKTKLNGSLVIEAMNEMKIENTNHRIIKNILDEIKKQIPSDRLFSMPDFMIYEKIKETVYNLSQYSLSKSEPGSPGLAAPEKTIPAIPGMGTSSLNKRKP